MARKVAHEIRNPLTPIQVSIEDLKRSYESHSPEFERILGDAVDTMTSEISRLKRLTDEFSEFARLPAPKTEPRDLRPVIGDALRIYADQIRSGSLRVRFPQEEVRVDVDADLFTQAIVNLVKNGFEASGPSGHVVVTLEKGQNIVRVVVEDDGPGVPDDLVDKLFTPHFTTKRHGSGLGLVISHRICFDHGGRLKYEKVDTGARFVIVLPLIGGSV
jgi:nitrogen fixation/metabolism regulation signal transduction histidine kinase